MSGIDKRNRLSEEPFSYQMTKKGTVIINYEGKQVKIVKGKEAEHLLSKIKEVDNDRTKVQLLLAKITGNFKRGNEKFGLTKKNRR